MNTLTLKVNITSMLLFFITLPNDN